ncbi:MAG: glucose PTS transporter subunit EIIB, partial [Brochothrix thermosphacta]
FVIFYFAILKFDIKTPGREDENAIEEDEEELATPATGDKYDAIGDKYLKALGGADNFTVIDNCTTRLRLQLKDTNIVDQDALKRAGAKGVVKINDTALQVIVGTDVEFVADKLKERVEK